MTLTEVVIFVFANAFAFLVIRRLLRAVSRYRASLKTGRTAESPESWRLLEAEPKRGPEIEHVARLDRVEATLALAEANEAKNKVAFELLEESRDDWMAKAKARLKRVQDVINERDAYKSIAETHEPVLVWPEPQKVDKLILSGSPAMVNMGLDELPDGPYAFDVIATIETHLKAGAQIRSIGNTFKGPGVRVRREIIHWMAVSCGLATESYKEGYEVSWVGGKTMRLNINMLTEDIPVKVVEVVRPHWTRDAMLSEEIAEAYAEVDAIAPVEGGG